MKIVLFFLALVASTTTFAQDNLIKLDGTEIEVKVVEVDVTSVKYKRFDNLDGPTYSIDKSKFFMIQYENGTKDMFSATSKKTKPQPKTPKKQKPKATPKEKEQPNQSLDLTLVPDSLRIRNHLFLFGHANGGLTHSIYQGNIYYNRGFYFGIGIEFGGVLYFAPKKMPPTFGLGLSYTLVNASINLGAGLIAAPYSTSLGPQFTFRCSPKIKLDFLVKPGLSIIQVNNVFAKAFFMEMGINFNYKNFAIGLSGLYYPTLYDFEIVQGGIRQFYTYTSTHTYSHIRIKIGATFGRIATSK